MRPLCRLPSVAVYRAKQLANPFEIGDSRMMANDHRRERTFEIRCRIAFRAACCNGIAKHLIRSLLCTVRSLMLAAFFKLAKDSKKLRGRDVTNGP